MEVEAVEVDVELEALLLGELREQLAVRQCGLGDGGLHHAGLRDELSISAIPPRLRDELGHVATGLVLVGLDLLALVHQHAEVVAVDGELCGPLDRGLRLLRLPALLLATRGPLNDHQPRRRHVLVVAPLDAQLGPLMPDAGVEVEPVVIANGERALVGLGVAVLKAEAQHAARQVHHAARSVLVEDGDQDERRLVVRHTSRRLSSKTRCWTKLGAGT